MYIPGLIFGIILTFTDLTGQYFEKPSVVMLVSHYIGIRI